MATSTGYIFLTKHYWSWHIKSHILFISPIKVTTEYTRHEFNKVNGVAEKRHPVWPGLESTCETARRHCSLPPRLPRPPPPCPSTKVLNPWPMIAFHANYLRFRKHLFELQREKSVRYFSGDNWNSFPLKVVSIALRSPDNKWWQPPARWRTMPLQVTKVEHKY